jgi:receptor expression-enhancing protein 1/2/3/4
MVLPLSRGSLGSTIVYKNIVHPNLMNKEAEIDQMLTRLHQRGYNAATKVLKQVFEYTADFAINAVASVRV